MITTINCWCHYTQRVARNFCPGGGSKHQIFRHDSSSSNHSNRGRAPTTRKLSYQICRKKSLRSLWLWLGSEPLGRPDQLYTLAIHACMLPEVCRYFPQERYLDAVGSVIRACGLLKDVLDLLVSFLHFFRPWNRVDGNVVWWIQGFVDWNIYRISGNTDAFV